MQNVEMKIEGKKLIVTVDLSKDFGPSKSGKSISVASTHGNRTVQGDIKMGLNVYKSRN